MKLFKKLQRKLTYLPNEAVEKIAAAYRLADQAHQLQKRHSGEPYITHPVAVACILADMHMDPQTIMAALLHDVIEDTGIEKQTIAEHFGSTVADLVDGVSKLTQIEFKNRAEAQAENFHKMVLAMSRDIRVMIIKLTDRLHNMRTLASLAIEKRRRIARETLDIYAPIANRLGMNAIYAELQNLAFMNLYPQRARILKTAIRKVLGNQRKIMGLVDKTLRQALEKHNLIHCHVVGREKNLYSIYQKMRTRGISFKAITDAYGFRIITDSVDTCYRVLGIVHGLYKPLPEKFKDYIAIPKVNGYQSLHTVLFGPFGIPLEVQIRTKAMDQLAESGIAAHWLYKSGEKSLDDSHVRAQQWVKNLLELQKKTGGSIEFFENVKIDLFPDEVYVFTPKGLILELPKGASVIDFAYAVHTDLGNTCVAAKVDRQLTSLSSELRSGQTVEIVTSVLAHPNPDWLNFVVTARARSGIRHYLRSKRRRQSVALGKELLLKSLDRLSLDLKKISPQAIQWVLQEAKLESFEDLLEELGLGNRMSGLVAHQLAGATEGLSNVPKSVLQETKPLLIKGTEGLVVHFATCCYPIPGDPIVGVVSVGQGLVVHMQQCKSVQRHKRDPDKYMAVSWAEMVEGEFVAVLRVTGENQRGVLAQLSQAIADADADIVDITVSEQDLHHYEDIFKLAVCDRKHLARVIRKLRQVGTVIKITRKYHSNQRA